MFRFLTRYRTLVLPLLLLVVILNVGVFLKAETLYSKNTFSGTAFQKDPSFSEVNIGDISLENINEIKFVPSAVFANVQRLYREDELFMIVVSFGGKFEDMVSTYFYESGILVKSEKKIKNYFAGRWSDDFSEDEFTYDIQEFILGLDSSLWNEEEKEIWEDSEYYKTVEEDEESSQKLRQGDDDLFQFDLSISFE